MTTPKPGEYCMICNGPAPCKEHTFEFMPGNDVNEVEDLMEKLAAIEHKRWSDWHEHAYNNWTPINITRWNQQAKTAYEDLPEPVKELDRREVRRYLPIFQRKIAALEKQLEIARGALTRIALHKQYSCECVGEQCSCDFSAMQYEAESALAALKDGK